MDSEKRFWNNKKVDDKQLTEWYDIKVAAEKQKRQTEHLDNWTVKQPWKFWKVLFKELTFKQ